MNWRTMIIVIITVFAVWQILRLFGVFEFNLSAQRTLDDIKRERKSKKGRQREQRKLALYASVINMFRGMLMTRSQYENHLYLIARLDLRSKVLNRLYTPEEYRGKYALMALVGVMLIPVAIFSKFVLVASGLLILTFIAYPSTLRAQVDEEDTIIDNNFLNLYLLMYSRLRMGSRARLQGVLESYIETLKNERNARVREVMLKFSRYILNTLHQYEDHVAIPKLRERYNSATVINFCNVAGQALQGVDNEDSLLTFKMQLVERKTIEMEKRSDRIYNWGLRSIYLVWVILAIFILVALYSKLPMDMMLGG